MKLYVNQLQSRLNSNFDSCYLVVGDEPLQLKESADSIRNKAKDLGFTEREVHHVDKKFSWLNLQASMGTMSLFAEKKLIELNLPTGKPGAAGSKAICEFVENIPADICLLVLCEQWTASNDKTKWAKTIEQKGAFLRVYLPKPQEFGQWIQRRCSSIGLNVEPQAIALLAARLEGNLLAASQELEKLKMRFGTNVISLQEASQLVSDNSRYDVFKLTDSLLAFESFRVIKMLRSLKQNGVSIIVVHWSIERELRMLFTFALKKQKGESLSATDFRKFGIWQQRQPVIQSALNKLSYSLLSKIQIEIARIDRVIKGQETGDAWIEMEKLVLLFCHGKKNQ